MGKEKKNKKIKKEALLKAGYDLFTTKGFNDTAISDITKEAGVAKGTFYLYFKDKKDLLDEIVFEKSGIVLKKAYDATKKVDKDNFADTIIFFVNYIIEYFKENKTLLKIIHKNLSWGMYKKILKNSSDDNLARDYLNFFIKGLEENGLEMEDVWENLFVIIELVGSICYTSIIYEEPTQIDKMKDIINKMLRKILKN